MLRTLTATLAVFASLALGQTPDRTLTFEVASIKPAAPQAMGRMMMGTRGGPGTPDPGRITFTNMPLSRIVMTAYGVKSFQVNGPSWMESEHFDITAKLPQGTTKEQYQVMLQNLLADRFSMKIHKEQKDVPLYTLVVAKGGSKLKESAEAPAGGDGQPAQLPPGPLVRGKDNVFRPPPGAKGMMMMFNGNRLRLEGSRVSMGELVDLLGEHVGRPVIDETGLHGQYDVSMSFSPEGSAMMKGMPIGPKPGDGAAGGGPAGAGPAGGGPEPPRDTEPAPSIFSAVQEQLGLKLESKKGPVDLIVVDSAEKTPTEN